MGDARPFALATLMLVSGCLKPTEGYLGPAMSSGAGSASGDSESSGSSTDSEGLPGEGCTPLAGEDTELAAVAAALGPGEWGELRSMNFVDSLLGNGGDWVATTTHSGVWDPQQRRAYILGQAFLVYDEATNSWSEHPTACDPRWQGEDHTSIDPRTSTVFHRVFGEADVGVLEGASGAWSSLPPIPTAFDSCCSGVEYFGARGELVYADASGVFLYSLATQQWQQPWSDIGLAGRILIEASPAADVVLLTGEPDQRIYTLDRDAQIREQASAPVDLTPGQTIVTPDLVTGEFLVLAPSRELYAYDPIADNWERREGVAPPFAAARSGTVNDFVAVPVSTHCITMFPVYDFDASTVLIYRHGA